MATTRLPDVMNAYVQGCVYETAEDIYGRHNRQPIHDAIRYIVRNTLRMCVWAEDLGLCVVDGKLCAVYDD